MLATKLIQRHWRGEYCVPVALGLILVAFGLAYHLLEPLFLAPFAESAPRYTIATLGYLLITRLIIFPWQIIGLLRSADTHFRSHNNSLVLYGIQITALVCVLLTIGHVITSLQKLVAFHNHITAHANAKRTPSYRVEIDQQRQTLLISGTFDFGIVDASKTLLSTPDSRITTVELSSNGGQIYEGRGLAQLFREYGLTTHVEQICASACATAFVGGTRRTLGTNGKLGFHRYGFDVQRQRQVSAFIDLEHEQQKDLQIFLQAGVIPEFLDRVFLTAHEQIWFPDRAQLLDARVITE